MDNNKITEKEVEEVVKVLQENTTEDQKLLASLPSNNGVLVAEGEPTEENYSEEVEVAVNPITGELTAAQKQEETELDKKMAELLNVSLEELNNIPESVNDIQIPDELLISTGAMKGISNSAMMELIPLLKMYREKSDDKNTNWYEKMPMGVKTLISKQCAELGNYSIDAKKMIAECILQEILQDATVDKFNIDFQESMQKALDLSPIIGMSIDQDVTTFEVNILEKAKEFREKGFGDKADQLEKVSEAFRQSYTLEKFKEVARTGKLRVKKFDIEKISRYIRDFNVKYEGDTPFIIHNIADTLPVLYRKFSDEYGMEDIQRFIISFIKFTANMSSHDVVDHTFMSYFISNILKLDLFSKSTEENKFINSIVENLDSAIAAAKIGSGVNNTIPVHLVK